jgi:inner membrane protein
MLTGAVMARAGLNRKAAYAVGAMAIAAEFPDVDMLWGLGGPLVGFEHHRGLTHTFLAAPVEAAVITAGFWVWHRWRKRGEALSWGWLFGGCWLAVLSHILLDWTNNYGVRPFFPFDAHWYAGSFVFIFEPVLFGLLVLALVMPALFGLIGSEVGARRGRFVGRGWAVFALVGIAALYVWRYTERGKAMAIATESAPAGTGRVFASPHMGNPFLWSTVAEGPEGYRLATIDTLRGMAEAPEPADTVVRPATTLALLAAKRTALGRVYLDWSMFPVLVESPLTDDPHHPLTQVTFEDARFLYDGGLFQRSKPPISGTAVLDMAAPEGERVVQLWMDGKLQK